MLFRSIYVFFVVLVVAVFVSLGALIKEGVYSRRELDQNARMSVAKSNGTGLAVLTSTSASVSGRAKLNFRAGEISGPAGYVLEYAVQDGCYSERGYLMEDAGHAGVHVLMRWLRGAGVWQQYGKTIREAVAAQGAGKDDLVIPTRYLLKHVVSLGCLESLKFEVTDLQTGSLVLLRWVPGLPNPWVVDESVTSAVVAQ